MGRRREHDENTAAALLDAAERVVAVGGVDAVSVRVLADQVGTTTRAIYSTFGSKDGLIAALGARTFDLLAAAVDALPVTDDPAADLVEAGVSGFRCFVMDHLALFRLGIQQTGTTDTQRAQIRTAATRAFTVLQSRVARLNPHGQLDPRAIYEAATAFHALCEGLAAVETRGSLPAQAAEQLWRNALTALVNGLTPSPPPNEHGADSDHEAAITGSP